jgi:hypothetical protein
MSGGVYFLFMACALAVSSLVQNDVWECSPDCEEGKARHQGAVTVPRPALR